MKSIKTYNYNLQVTIDSKEIEKKYPNYRFNFNNTDDFIQFIINNIQNNEYNNLEEFGYSIDIKEQKF